jgi:hypothetical protein
MKTLGFRVRVRLGLAVAAATVVGTAIVARGQMSSTSVPRLIPYEGRLERNGAAFDGNLPADFALYAAADAPTPLWGPESHTLAIVAGRFHVDLGSTTAIDPSILAQGGLFLGITVDGVPLSGRQRFLASPYALRSAQPEGLVAFFNRPTCPPGWREVTALRGRYVVGLPENGTPGAAIGSALADQENRPVGRHAHPVNDPGHAHRYTNPLVGECKGRDCGDGTAMEFPSSEGGQTTPSSTGLSVQETGAVAGTNAPYVQLIACTEN